MVIDFHTHIFPDRIAPVTIPHLAEVSGIPPYTNGTAVDLRRSMTNAGVDMAVVLPVVTKPSQFDSINHFAAEINAQQDRLISFGGIHPDCENIEEKLDIVVALGLKGIKLHPDYQGVFIDDERYIRILQAAIDRDLLVSIHAGIDIGLPDPVHCPPDRTRRALDRLQQNVNDPKIILAHTGGYGQWDEVERLLVGQSVYFDISFSLGHISDDQLVRIIGHHGADRVLFATDSPWGGQTEALAHFRRLPLNAHAQEQILWRNAAKLLGVPETAAIC